MVSQEILIPFAFFSTVGIVVWLFLHFGVKRRTLVHETLRLAIENGQALSAETIDRLTQGSDQRRNDLRRGVLCIAVGVSFLLLGAFLMSTGVAETEPMIGIAIFPTMIGIAYLGLWGFSRDGRSD